jgi:Nif11 domain
MAEDALDELRRLVVDDRQLRDRLLSVSDHDAFVLEVVDVAQACGIELSGAEVVEGLGDARRRRFERWV